MKFLNKANIKLLSILLIAILVTIFAVLNSANVNINFGFTEVFVSQALVILVSVTIGAILMYVATIYQNYISEHTKTKKEAAAKNIDEKSKNQNKVEEKDKLIDKDNEQKEINQTENDKQNV